MGEVLAHAVALREHFGDRRHHGGALGVEAELADAATEIVHGGEDRAPDPVPARLARYARGAPSRTRARKSNTSLRTMPSASDCNQP